MNAKQISAAKTSELVAFYNECAALLGGKPVNKFADRKTAERRVADIFAERVSTFGKLSANTKPAKASKGQAETERRAAVAKAGGCPECGSDKDAGCITHGRIVDVAGHQEERDMHIAFCHHCSHTFNHQTGKAAKFTGERGEQHAKAIAASWADPEVKAARTTRHHVTVNGVEYRSVREAFRALGLPDSKHIKFRMDLKATGKQAFNGIVFVLGE